MEDYIIARCNTMNDGIEIMKFTGDPNSLKRELITLVNKDREDNWDYWDEGAESVDDIVEDGKFFHAFATYHTYHIDYTAVKLSNL